MLRKKKQSGNVYNKLGDEEYIGENSKKLKKTKHWPLSKETFYKLFFTEKKFEREKGERDGAREGCAIIIIFLWTKHSFLFTLPNLEKKSWLFSVLCVCVGSRRMWGLLQLSFVFFD